MRKSNLIWIVLLMTVALLAGCGNTQDAEPATSETAIVVTESVAEEVPTEEVSTEEAPTEAVAEEEEGVVYEDDAYAYYIDVVYAEQIARYRTALSEKWNEVQYMESGMSEVVAAYYEGNPLENIGFGFVDLDNDGHWELVIGAILDAEEYPSVFEIWTLVDEKTVMLAQAHARTQYDLQYVEEDEM